PSAHGCSESRATWSRTGGAGGPPRPGSRTPQMPWSMAGRGRGAEARAGWGRRGGGGPRGAVPPGGRGAPRGALGAECAGGRGGRIEGGRGGRRPGRLRDRRPDARISGGHQAQVVGEP